MKLSLFHILIMENIEDEIEFFGFLPITFTTDLQESLEETFHEIMQHNHPVHSLIQTRILEAFKKNIFIFNNFILRNILKFPVNYKYERKNSDKVIQEDVKNLIERLCNKQKEAIELEKKKLELTGKLLTAIDINNGYRDLLKNKDKYHDMTEAAKEISKFLNETMEIYENFKILTYGKDSDFENLLEFKNIKNIYYKEEKKRLFEIASLETLEYITKKINNK